MKYDLCCRDLKAGLVCRHNFGEIAASCCRRVRDQKRSISNKIHTRSASKKMTSNEQLSLVGAGAKSKHQQIFRSLTSVWVVVVVVVVVVIIVEVVVLLLVEDIEVTAMPEK